MADLDALTVEELEALQSGGLDALSVEALQRLQGTVMPMPPMEAAQAPTPSVTPPTGLERAGNLAMEGISGFNRAGLASADFLTSPLQALAQVGGFDLPTFSEQGTPRGAFAGDGLATDVAASAGELSNLSAVSGGILRKAAQSLDDVIRFIAPSSRDATTLNVVRTLGNTTAADDIALGAVSGGGGAAGGEAAASVVGEEFKDTGRLLGEVVSPAVWVGATQSLLRVGRNMLDNTAAAAPTPQELKNTSRLMYNKLDEAGVTTDGPSTALMQNRINKFIADNNINTATGTGAISSRLRAIAKEAEAGGVSFGFLDQAQTSLQKLAGTATDTPAKLARDASDMLGSFLADAAPNIPIGAEGLNAQGVVDAAKSLWRRGSVAENIDEIVKTAAIDSDNTGVSYLATFRKKLNDLRKPNSKEGRFLTAKEKDMIGEAIKGGRVENFLKLASNIGFNSNDLVRSVLVTSLVGSGGFAAGGAGGSAAAILGATAIGSIAEAGANNIFKRNATAMRAYMRAGSNAEDITRLYMRTTPRAKRDPAELTKLFLVNQVDLTALRDTGLGKMPLVADSVALGIVAQSMMSEEAKQPPQQ
jgi:hypothetical protein